MFMFYYFVKYCFAYTLLLWFLYIIKNMDESTCKSQQFLRKLEESFKKFEELLHKEVSLYDSKI